MISLTYASKEKEDDLNLVRKKNRILYLLRKDHIILLLYFSDALM